jgi:alkyl sulfatase BDS1-like metallo-beta-lactamase superfamily hydrolase
MQLSNGVLVHHPTRRTTDADLLVTLTKDGLLQALATGAVDGLELKGDPEVLAAVLGLVDDPDPDFAIVTP